MSVPVSPSAAQVRAARGGVLPAGGEESFLQNLGGAVLGAAVPAVLITILPSNEKWVGAGIAGLFGGIGVLASPVGTWVQEASGGMLAASLLYGILNVLSGTGSSQAGAVRIE